MKLERKFVWMLGAGAAIALAALCAVISIRLYAGTYYTAKGNIYLQIKDNLERSDYALTLVPQPKEAESGAKASSSSQGDDFFSAMDRTARERRGAYRTPQGQAQLESRAASEAEQPAQHKALLTVLGVPIGLTIIAIGLLALLMPGIDRDVRLFLKFAILAVAFSSITLTASANSIGNRATAPHDSLIIAIVFYAVLFLVFGGLYLLAKRWIAKVSVAPIASVIRDPAPQSKISWTRGALRVWLLFSFVWIGNFVLEEFHCLSLSKECTDEIFDTYTLAPAGPIALVALWFVGRWVTSGFKRAD